MKTTWSWWGRHEIGVVLRTSWNCLCKCNHFRGVFATRVLRVYYVYGDVTTLGSRPSRPHRLLTAFHGGQIAEPWRLFWACSKQLFYHVYTTLMATLARSGPIFRRRRRAVRTPPWCDGDITHSPLVGKVLRVFLTVKNSRRSCATIGERMNSQHGLIFGRSKVGSIASHSQRSQVSRGAVLCGCK